MKIRGGLWLPIVLCLVFWVFVINGIMGCNEQEYVPPEPGTRTDMGPNRIEEDTGQSLYIDRADLDLTTVRHDCSYCGGWEEEVYAVEVITTTWISFLLQDETVTPPERREVCIRCLIKAFDEILGKPME